jgi:hypothetical protein
MMVGTAEGEVDGTPDGAGVGVVDGSGVGAVVGMPEGAVVGVREGAGVGLLVGWGVSHVPTTNTPLSGAMSYITLVSAFTFGWPFSSAPVEKMQWSLSQSLSEPQGWPLEQGAQPVYLPPQSTPVSPLSLMPFEQKGPIVGVDEGENEGTKVGALVTQTRVKLFAKASQSMHSH